MYLLDVIPLTKIPHPQPQILSYFCSQQLPVGALIKIPLGRRQEEGVVIGSRDLTSSKMEIKNADFELRNITKIISASPVLTKQQIELALFLGEYYFCSPGIFAKMALPRLINSNQSTVSHKKRPAKSLKLILAPTISRASSLTKSYPNAIIWHSELPQKQKNENWRKIKNGENGVVIGTRSAVFLPFHNLRKITIIDADSPNHRSWDMFPHYDSRLAAQKLTEIFNCKIKYFCHPEQSEGSIKDSSATPQNDNLIAPAIIDMRQELKDGNFSIFSTDLYEATKKALAGKKQIILFINRRGAANFILCRDCGYVANCLKCESPLAYHLINNKPALLCHHCGAKDTPPGRCPKCHSWKIKTVGSGSQKVETEAHNFFPDAKISRLDSDSAQKPKNQQKVISDFVEGKTEILIATPIVFSWLKELAAAQPAIIGILSADTLLHIPDFRSGERTWQMIAMLQSLYSSTKTRNSGARGEVLDYAPQNAGLRSNNNTGFIIQTYSPDNSVLKYIGNNDYAGFAKEDTETREALNYPPFSQIVKLSLRLRDAKRAGQEAKILQAKLTRIASHPERSEGSKLLQNKLEVTNNKSADKIEISSALPAFLPRERGKYVWNIIIKFPIPNFQFSITNEFLLQRNSLLQYVPAGWEIDIDPENLL